MGQELYVLRCYSCLAFQSHQVRKDRKFVCKVCGAKQSVKKNYGQGTGKDCRNHVQKLNMLRGTFEIEQERRIESQINENEKAAELPWEDSTYNSAMFITTSNINSHLSDESFGDSETNRISSAGDSAMASSTHSNGIKEDLDAGFDHESPEVTQKRKWKQKTHQGPTRSHINRRELMRQDNWSSRPYPGSLVNISGRKLDVGVQASKGGNSERLDPLENWSIRLGGEQNLIMNKRDSTSSRGVPRSSSESLLESTRKFGEREEEVMRGTKHLPIRNATNCKIDQKAYFGNSDENSDKNCKTRIQYQHNSDKVLEESLEPGVTIHSKENSKECGQTQHGILKIDHVSGYVSKETSCDYQMDRNILSVRDTSPNKDTYPIPKINQMLNRKGITQQNNPTTVDKMHVKEMQFTPSVKVVNCPAMKTTINKPLDRGKQSSVNIFAKNLKGFSSALSQLNSGLGKQGTFHAEATYNKYEAAEEFEDIVNFDL
ncbi:MRN complex-interacting protein-like [Homarus americanus]|uniref:MRN complex-interacting protein-like n=1 Tax=Homarus americanus TaxID=6706 RepID=A0A8J5JJW7_HOMAM|nr:MRN complex-interacting protein-like [Homarus americanus]